MRQYSRIIIALAILLSGVALVPQMNVLGGTVTWQRFIGGYGDVVVVTRARYDDDDTELEVRATSSSGGQATLTVYETSTNQLIGTLTFEGDDEYRGEFLWPRNPQVVTVRSTLGGESTVLVTDGSEGPPTVTPSVSGTPSLTTTPSRTPLASTTASATATSSATGTVRSSATPTATTGPDRRELYLPMIVDNNP
jgi:hypothetical protein